MAALYPGTSVSGYNSSPPPDDGSTGSTNLITWNIDVKGKIGDPLNTFASNVDSNITSAFGKTIDGAAVLAEGVNYQVLAADQGKLIKATASGITITTPDATVVNAPFMFAVNNQSSGTITLAGANPGVQQNIDGSATQTVQAGGSCIVKTDGSNWFTIGLKSASNALGANNYGFTDPVNLNLVASVATNIMTIAVKTKAGNDPTSGDPVLIPFRDTTNANGDPVWVTLSSALSINTNATGATLGSQNSTPFRFWILAFNNGGSVVLALWHSGAGASTLALNPLNEGTLQSTTGISAAATSAGTFYTPNGISLASKAFRIIGYLEYTSGLTTAGTYASSPNIVQLFGPGVKKPGDLLQVVTGTNTTAATTSSATYAQLASAPAPTITPTSTTSVIELEISSNISNTGAAANNSLSWSRGTSANTNIIGTSGYTGSQGSVPVHLRAFDTPATTSSQTYTIQGKTSSGTVSLNVQTVACTQVWTLKEYMA